MYHMSSYLLYYVLAGMLCGKPAVCKNVCSQCACSVACRTVSLLTCGTQLLHYQPEPCGIALFHFMFYISL